MKVCLESYLLINIMMNALVMDMATRALGRRRLGRVLAAAALGGVWAALIYVPGCERLGSLPFRMAVPALMALVACGGGGVRDWASCMSAALCMTMLLGGDALMISLTSGGWGWAQLGWCLVTGGLAGLWLTRTKLRRAWGWELKVRICAENGECRVTALVDTGNHLREPLSGACVLIVSERALRSILPRGFDARDAALPGKKWRMVRYSTLDGQGLLKCFCPECVCVRAGSMRAVHTGVWVAVYPGSLPGGAQALAPLELSTSAVRSDRKGACGDAACTLKG